ncbi:hypothetical protein CKO38_17185 [Rhodospirillum rubrum]|uniref:putative bifunctional diguanylate cyclase/phosphodiesterase n=1 Tax=Rhodospirillum rubrum TaxID=1085 RepID=UPI001905C0C9|nr:EAL domain-containing protein [Rhodospirillum rubrum]MBK1665495.1 hypothetical protein [Rhodospirillum rubrum]MBK1678371.1 hypothetical protein [Rhodospirillum rubrum]
MGTRERPPIADDLLAWRILSVDDDDAYRRSLAFALDGTTLLGRPIIFLEARSYTEAAALLAGHTDIAVVLLDVVMETDDAGLRLVNAVRDVLGNSAVRIVLLTGQLGMAPLADVMVEYDINDYWMKSELSVDRLLTVLAANVRTYDHIQAVARARHGLQLIVESTNALFNSGSIEVLAATVLTEIGTLLDLGQKSIVCGCREPSSDGGFPFRIIGATGCHAHLIGQPIDALNDPTIIHAIKKCLSDGQEYDGGHYRVLPFFSALEEEAYVIYLDIDRPLDETEKELLHVFATNIRGGLHNVALVNRLDTMAYSDPLLKIPNKNAFVRAIHLALSSEQRHVLNFVLVDIDNFSSLNAALGTKYGDDVLEKVVMKLRDGLGHDVMVARLSNDLFAALGHHSRVESEQITALFYANYDAIDTIDLHNVSVSAVTMPLSQITAGPEQAINDAVIALRAAKRAGISQHRAVDSSAGAVAAKNFKLLYELKRAIAGGEIGVVFQPQIDLITGAVCGVEMLARWTTADGKVIPPDVFIPLAETSGLILPLGERLFEMGCEAAAHLDVMTDRPLRIAINVSPIQFAQHDLFDRFKRLMETYGVSPGRIEIEITESGIMRETRTSRDNLSRCHEAQMEIAIDDFGIGFSSLSQLRSLPADRLKIDRCFINEIGEGGNDIAIADMVIKLGRRFSLRVLAEGVEDVNQAIWLRRQGCDEAQGYFFARPMPLATLLVWLAAWHPTRGLAMMDAETSRTTPC